MSSSADLLEDASAPDGPVTDGTLLRAARLGDQGAFRQIVDRHGPGMYRYARTLVGHEQDAGDVLQEAFVSAWKNLPTFRGESSLKTWLFRLVHRRAMDHHRTRRPVPVTEEVFADVVADVSGDPVRQAESRELLADLRRCLGELPETQRACWLLREVEGMSYQDIGDTLGLPVGSVRGQLHRARTTLAERMSRWR
ncbi:RNA polymerase sigma factor [uncultured Serinicoccus sp.]|uniref:RNA polymerase sigma factor n=1 Tax=uncultured Serinicoccus sp. TaxID=735514 RepID=UPI00261D92BE|nr:RNA polymerase sigma factor [uncultured Serinicoccus sp.]